MRAGGKAAAARLAVALAIALAVFFAFIALGSWQLQRRVWKHELIAHVDQRVHALPVAAPSPDRWSSITAAEDEYRHVRLTGSFLPGRSAFVQAVSDLGGGYWVMTPLSLVDGNAVVWVNRGFVESGSRTSATRAACVPQGEVVVTGLLRLTEPGGGFLRHNDPAADRWYSRDVQAIATARGVKHAAPYFVDADATIAPGSTPSTGRPDEPPAGCPVGGLTVIAFNDNHGVYAITWYTLALMTAGAWAVVLRSERKRLGAAAR